MTYAELMKRRHQSLAKLAANQAAQEAEKEKLEKERIEKEKIEQEKKEKEAKKVKRASKKEFLVEEAEQPEIKIEKAEQPEEIKPEIENNLVEETREDHSLEENVVAEVKPVEEEAIAPAEINEENK